MGDLVLGVQLTILGMGMVLFILSILYLAVAVMGRIVNRESAEPLSAPGEEQTPSVPAEEPEPESAPPQVRDERKRVVAISAAVTAYKRIQHSRRAASRYMVPLKDDTGSSRI